MKKKTLDGAEITTLLRAWDKGSQDALNRVIALVYHDLRRMARYYLQAGNPHATLQSTALVHEVYQRLAGAKELVFEGRAHFFNCACLIMRQVLMRSARRHGAKNGKPVKLAYAEDDPPLEAWEIPDRDTLLALDQALTLLAELDPRRHRIVELRFFVGLSLDEIAELLAISPRTIRREWLTARRWLARELGETPDQGLRLK